MTSAFNVPSTIITGPGSRLELGAQAQRLKARRALIVSDRFMEESGVVAQAAENLGEAGIDTHVFSGVLPDPTVANVMDGVQQLKEFKADLVVGLGGGSSMDAAKAIAIMSTNKEPITQYAGYHQVPKAGMPLILIPTTAGTGSEVTKVAVITDTERDVKMMMLDIHLLPQVALVDYKLSMTMPQPLTAHVGVDTLTHGIEAYVSTKAHALTDPIALSCIRLAADNIHTAFHQPGNEEAREAMMVAACQGGMAFANSSVCLIHGMSRPLGAHFHLTHGLSNAVLLPEATKFSLAGARRRYATVARTVSAADDSDSDDVAGNKLLDYLEELNRELSIPRLSAIIDDETSFKSRLTEMAEASLASGSPNNNPVIPVIEEIEQIYLKAW